MTTKEKTQFIYDKTSEKNTKVEFILSGADLYSANAFYPDPFSYHGAVGTFDECVDQLYKAIYTKVYGDNSEEYC